MRRKNTNQAHMGVQSKGEIVRWATPLGMSISQLGVPGSMPGAGS